MFYTIVNDFDYDKIKLVAYTVMEWKEFIFTGLKIVKNAVWLFVCLFVCLYFFLQNYMYWANFNLTLYKTPLVEGFVGWVSFTLER